MNIPIKEKTKLNKIKDLIHGAGSDSVAIFGGTFEGGIHLQQNPDEYAEFIYMVEKLGGINSLLEIGSAAGGNFAFLTQYFGFAQAEAFKKVLIDVNMHPKAHYRSIILRNTPHMEIISDSHRDDTYESVRGTFDMVFIDGDHSYEGVKADYYMYRDYSRKFIAFHDIADYAIPTGDGDNVVTNDGVTKFWKELLDDEQTHNEFYVYEFSHLCGIGLLVRK